MDLDTALYYVMSDDLGIRVSSRDEAEMLVKRTTELGLPTYIGSLFGVPDRWSIYGWYGVSTGPTFWRGPSDFTKPHDIVDFCDLVHVTVDATDIQNLL